MGGAEGVDLILALLAMGAEPIFQLIDGSINVTRYF